MLRISNTGLIVALTALILVLFVNTTLTYRNTVGLEADAQRVEHSHKVIQAIYEVRSAVKDSEVGQRGYMITGDELYLKPYMEALQTIDTSLARLSLLITDNPRQGLFFEQLQYRIDDKRAELAEMVEMRAKQGFDAAKEKMMSGRGRANMEAIFTQIDAMVDVERTLLSKRQELAAKNFRSTLLTGQVTGGALIALLLATVVLIRRNLSSRAREVRILEEHHDLLHTTLASIVEGIVVSDVDGKVSYINPIAERMTGIALKQAMGMSLASVYQPGDELSSAEESASQPQQLGRSGELMQHRRRRFQSADGQQRVIDELRSPLHNHMGEIVGMVLALRDVTEHQRTERTIAEAKAFAESIVDSIPDPLLILDHELRVRSANLSYYEKYAAQESETLGKLLVELDGGRWHNPAVFNLLRNLGTDETQVRSVEIEQELPRLGVRTIVLLARGLRGADEHAGLILLAAQDESETRDNQRRIQQLLSNVQDNAGRMREVAAASLTLNSAHTRESVVAVLQEGARRILDADEAVVILEPVLPREYSAQLNAALSGRDGTPVGFVALRGSSNGRARDGDATMLQQLAHVASVALENARLYEELRAGDRRKDEFLATLAHELRNPLAPVRNAVQVLRSSRAGSQDRDQALAMIERQVVLLVRLVDDLLDVSRITRGKIVLKRQRVELSEVVGQALDLCRPSINASGHSLAVQLPSEPLFLHADPFRLSQVLSNLLNNAAKYTERGGHIWLACKVENNQVAISVSDDGMGIDPQSLPHIFDMFWQYDDALERAQGGLGIGLSLVRQLVDLQGGRVEAKSLGQGTGSEFIVYLDIESADALAARAPPTADLPTQPAESSREPIAQRILVVDDNIDSAESLSVLLRLQGHEVQTAFNGERAVELALEFQPRCILLDIGLPNLNGYDAARAIRAQNGPAMTLVAMTGWGRAEDRRRSQEAGFDHHLVKPVDTALLQSILAGLDVPAS
jgi:PAS domain S-box-containing protein